jgi:flagellar basal-body rod protein FlgB
MTTDISLFQAMGSKMKYLNHRQRVISQNIANADTPNFQPKDLTKVDFGRVLKKISGDNSIQMVSTNANHMPALGKTTEKARVREQKDTYEVSPDKNGVVLEEQLIKSNDVQMNYNLMVNLYRQNVDLIRTSLGRRG